MLVLIIRFKATCKSGYIRELQKRKVFIKMKDTQMVSFHDRLNTFVEWKGPSALHMAASGFFYKGPGDFVQC